MCEDEGKPHRQVQQGTMTILRVSERPSVMSNSLRPHGLKPARLLLFIGFSRQEYWSGLPFPSQGDLPDPGIKPGSPTLQAGSLASLLSEPPAEASAIQVEELLKGTQYIFGYFLN